jgi:hypothetical protein
VELTKTGDRDMSKIDIIASREAYLAKKSVTLCPPRTAFGGESKQRRLER